VYCEICENSLKPVRGEPVEPYEWHFQKGVRILRQAQDERV